MLFPFPFFDLFHFKLFSVNLLISFAENSANNSLTHSLLKD